MKRRSYAGTALLWFVLVVAFSLAFHQWGNGYHRAIAAVGERLAAAWAPDGVAVRIEVEGRAFFFSAGRGEIGQRISYRASLMDASAALFLATVLLTPLGSAPHRLFVGAAAFAGLIGALGGVAAGLALLPMVQMEFLTSRVAWRLAALSHNAATSGLVISAPAAGWFLLTFSWWKQGFSRPKKGREGKGRRGGRARQGRKGKGRPGRR
jgi:hypothetical protein